MLISFERIAWAVQCFVIDIASFFPVYTARAIYNATSVGSPTLSLSFVETVVQTKKEATIFTRARKRVTSFGRS